MSDKSYHEKLDEIQRDLAWIVQYLLKMNQPIQPPPYNPWPGGIMPVLPRKCPRCGLDLSGAMAYVCNDQQCPTFARVTCVTTGQHSAVQLNETFGLKSDEGYNG